MPRYPLALLLLIPAGLLAAFARGPSKAPTPSASPRVKLAVVIYFDQLRGDYLETWRPLFGEGGFRRLQDDGAWYVDCHYPYATTTTGPGHASALAGCSGDTHGIINNNWYDRKAGAEVYCAASDRYQFVPAKPVDPKTKKPKDAGNPDRMVAETVADRLNAATGGRGKVFGLSLKDRSAIFPAGKQPDGAYWFDGQFVTSTYYRESLPPWVAEFNKIGMAESYYGKDWVKLRSDLNYEEIAGPDDGIGEGSGTAQGVTFPHSMTGGEPNLTGKYYEALANSPFGNELLLALAKQCVIAEKLGEDDVPDLLSVSFSSNDLIGHTWGPDSQEVFDVTLRSDLIVAEFLHFLDGKVGAGNYSVILTADHGICPNPASAAARGLDAQQLSPSKLTAGVEKLLTDAYGSARKKWIEAVVFPHVYLNERLLKSANRTPEEAADLVAEWMRKQEGIQHVYTRKQLLNEAPASEVAAMVRRSYHPDRGGDLVVVQKPYWLYGEPSKTLKPATGTTHGTPHAYDTHVPFLAFGPGIPGGKRTDRVTPLHGSAVVSEMLGVRPPATAQYAVPVTLRHP